MNKENIVFIARSLDGHIADKNGGIDWLHSVPNRDGIDMGYGELMNRVDALIMGRNTYEKVLSFGIDWPYPKHVYVLTSTLKEVPSELNGKVSFLSGSLKEVLDNIHNEGYNSLYIDGGKVIQAFLQEDLIDELILTTIPILLGGGSPLFGELEKPIHLAHFKTEVFLDQVVQTTYKRKNNGQ